MSSELALLDLPLELIERIVSMLDEAEFYSFSLVCERIGKLCICPDVQDARKTSFSKHQLQLQDLLFQPDDERVIIRRFSTLPCGWRFGLDTTWSHKVKLKMVVKESGLCLEGVIDFNDKKLVNRQTWQDDKLTGESASWYPNGTSKSIKHWQNGQIEGEEQLWYEDGTLKQLSYWHQGKLEGVQQVWHKDGTPKSTKLWKEGNQRGNEKEWNENGELVRYRYFPMHPGRGRRIRSKNLLKKKKNFPFL